jgi:chromosome partitioning protein
MKIIAIVSQKGGAGKTTVALHIAVAADHAGLSVALIDMDPQATAETWAVWRKNDEHPAVVAAKAPTLTRTLEKAEKLGADLVVIDTPPLAQAEASEAVRAADLILIPCRPAAFDLHAVRMTARLAQSVGKPAFVMFNGGPPNAPHIYSQAAELVGDIGLAVAPMRLSDRSAFRAATNTGQAAQEIEPKGKAAAETAAVWEWLAKTLNMKTSKRAYAPARKEVLV